MITLHLHGALAEDYGDTFKVEAATPREAVVALAYQCPKYRETLTTNNWHIFVGKENDITEQELDISLGKVTDVYLMPVIQGASGAFNFVVGSVLVIAGVFLNATGVGAPIGTMMIGAGIGMMIGGIIQMTTKMPGADDMSRDSVDEKASFLFGGPTNTATQGVAIPRGYGRMMVGSVVVSVALYSEQLQNVNTSVLTQFPGLKKGGILWKNSILA